MRILQIIDTLRVGGAQRLMVTLARQAYAHQVRLTIVSLSELKDGMALAPQLQDLGAEVVVFPAPNLFTLSRLHNLLSFVRQGGFSVIHSHLTYANIIAGVVGKLLKVPVVATLHSTAVDRRHAHFLRDKIEQFALQQAGKVLAVGQKVADVYQQTLKREVVVLPNAVDENIGLSPGKRKELRENLIGDAARKVLISVGRLSPDKAFIDLLNAFALVRQHFPKTALIIVGDGVLRADLEQQTKSLGLDGQVFWLGTRNDVPRLLAASDLYVSSSRREGLSLSLLEAMMAGLPLVVTEVGEARNLIRNDAGIIVPSAAPDKLAAAVLEILNSGDLGKSLGQAGLARARAEYGAKQWFMRLMDIYDEVKSVAREQVDVHA
jgi:glycosyltransferase involved in cell wall biosynthesis